MIKNTYCLWRPKFQGHMSNFKIQIQIQGILWRTEGQGPEIWYADVSRP